MNFSILQIILLVVIAFALSRVLLRTREKQISIKVAFFWVLVWGAAITFILLPSTTSTIAHILGVGRGADVVTYVSLLLLFYLIFRIYVMIEGIKRDITSLVRKMALEGPKRGKRREKR